MNTLGLSDQELMALVQISYIDWDFIGVDVRGLTVRSNRIEFV